MSVNATAGKNADETVDDKESTVLEMRLFGPFEVRIGGQPLPPLRYRKDLWLLALLALRHNQEVPRDWLAGTFWPENDESKSLFYLRKSLSSLRNALGAAAPRLLSPTPRSIRLDLTDAITDFVVFDTAVARPRTEAGEDAGAEREERLLEAVSLYRGPLLQDCTEDWVTVERETRAQSYVAALEALAKIALSRGEPASAARWLRLALVSEPYRESAARSLLQALADSGDRAAMQQVYQELRTRLRTDLNAAPAPETEALYKQLLTQEVQPLPPPAAPVAPSRRHLPVPLTDLIGRDKEIAEVSGWLGRRRLVTLLGTGGVGKTRLSIAAADAALPRFPDGVWFIDFASLTKASFVPEVMAKTLGVSPTAGLSTEEGLIEALSVRSLLLVLDNCEHLLDACASLADRLLSACPGLRILATSRQALGVTGEQVYPVPSLALPSPQEVEKTSGLLDIEKNSAFLLEYAGIQLFVQRAIQANPSFRLDRRNARTVAEICQCLDGIPLAIEMAAARLRSLSIGDIQARLSDRFRLLTSGSRSAMPRQQTLRALVDWSYSLLSAQEQSLLSRLSVFAGGWTWDAAEKVCAGDGVEAWEILDALMALVEKSLVVYEKPPGAEGEVRYRLLETIRQYAGERLREAEYTPLYQERHCAYFLEMAEGISPKLTGPEQARWLDHLETEHDNLRQVLAFCEAESVQKGLHLMVLLASFWLMREHLNEGRRHCTILLAQAEKSAPTSEQAAVWMIAGNMAYCLGDNATARQHFEASLALRQELGNRQGLAGVLGSLGNVAHLQGDYAAAQAYFEESIAICREFGLRNYEATGLTCLSNLASAQNKFTEARMYAEAALAVCRQVGNLNTESMILNGLGNIAMALDDYVEAVSYYEQVLTMDRKVGYSALKANALFNLGTARACLGETAMASALYCEALSLKQEGGDQRTVASFIEIVANFLANQDHMQAACRVWGAAEKLREDFDSARPPREQAPYDHALARVRQSLEREAIDAAWTEGREMTTADAIAYAIRETGIVGETAGTL
jgi:predicted ATPase/DNA-binding SARP family transcriptional activator